MKIKKKCSWGHYYTREPQTRAPDESGLTFELWHGAKKKTSIKITYQPNMTRQTTFLHKVYLSNEVFS